MQLTNDFIIVLNHLVLSMFTVMQKMCKNLIVDLTDTELDLNIQINVVIVASYPAILIKVYAKLYNTVCRF